MCFNYPITNLPNYQIKNMLFIDDILLSPFAGFSFIMRTILKMAEEEFTDDAPLKEQLLNLQRQSRRRLRSNPHLGPPRARRVGLRATQAKNLMLDM